MSRSPPPRQAAQKSSIGEWKRLAKEMERGSWRRWLSAADAHAKGHSAKAVEAREQQLPELMEFSDFSQELDRVLLGWTAEMAEHTHRQQVYLDEAAKQASALSSLGIDPLNWQPSMISETVLALKDEAKQAVALDCRRDEATRAVMRLRRRCLHGAVSHALEVWRRRSLTLAVSVEALLAGERMRGCALMLCVRACNENLILLRLLGGAFRMWTSAVAECGRRVLSEEPTDGVAALRSFATPSRRHQAIAKLCHGRGRANAADLHRAVGRWRVAIWQMEHAAQDELASEARRLRAELAGELRQNALLQQQLASADRAKIEARSPGGPSSPPGSPVEAKGTREMARQLHEARRHASVAERHVEELDGELARAHRELDRLRARGRGAGVQGGGVAGGRMSGEVAALQLELDHFRRFAALAGGAHRFARWRIFTLAMQRKRAEQRAATAAAAAAQQATRQGAMASRAAPSPPSPARALLLARRKALTRIVSPAAGAPYAACCRALWRWRCAATHPVASAAGHAAGHTAGHATGAQSSSLAVLAAPDTRPLAVVEEETRRAHGAEQMLHALLGRLQATSMHARSLADAVDDVDEIMPSPPSAARRGARSTGSR